MKPKFIAKLILFIIHTVLSSFPVLSSPTTYTKFPSEINLNYNYYGRQNHQNNYAVPQLLPQNQQNHYDRVPVKHFLHFGQQAPHIQFQRNSPNPSINRGNVVNPHEIKFSKISNHYYAYDNPDTNSGNLTQGIKKLVNTFKTKEDEIVISPRHDEVKQLPRVPGLPNTIPLSTVNITNVVYLLELAANDTEIDTQTETLLVQTLSELATFIGLQDLRDWIGLVMMYFISGPILIPLFWLPVTLSIMGALMIPLVVNGASVAAAGGGRSFNSIDNSSANDTMVYNDDNQWESYCIEMFSCELDNFLRSTWWSNWISKTFNLTTVEWAATKRIKNRRNGRGSAVDKVAYFQQDECSKYKCALVKPVQRFFTNWYSYFFKYQKELKTKQLKGVDRLDRIK